MDYVAGITRCVYCKQNHVTTEGSEPSLDSDLPSDQISFRSILLDVGITVNGGDHRMVVHNRGQDQNIDI